MKTYKKGVDLFLINGDIYLTDPSISNGFNTYSTKEHPGTKLLDRTKFIKPVNIDELAKQAVPDGYNKYTSIAIREAWKAGYRANKAEFTRDQMIEAISMAFMSGRGMLYTVEGIINKISYVSLPELIKINDNDEIVEVVW